MTALKLSVLDLIPVRTDQTTSDALAASTSLAKVADDLGYTRYWVAEHHNMPAVASTNPAVLLAMLGAATDRIRLGSGGVMLPNHQPLVIAEQFSLLEAAYPGRVDIGFGRAPGSDPVTTYLLRGNPDSDPASRFPDELESTLQMLRVGGLELSVQAKKYDLNATPKATDTPEPWLLGSSRFSAQLAATRGLPYVYAHHFTGQGTKEMLDIYRSNFQPSEYASEPRTFLTANVIVADTTERAERLAAPQYETLVRLRTGQELKAQSLVEEAEENPIAAHHRAIVESMRASWIVGTPAEAKEKLLALADYYDVDEIMVQPVPGAFRGTPANTSPEREATLRALATEFDLSGTTVTSRQ